MRAIRINQYGGPEALHLEDIELGEPGPGQAKVKLAAAGVNFIDIYRRRGTYPVQLPYTPGLEGAGVVESVGPNVNAVKPGDHVMYTGQPGSYAEATLAQADALIPVPPGFSFELAAAIPLQGMTVHYLIHEYHLPRSGETVLIHAAAGGVGLLLVQWAKRLGAHVIGTVSTEEKAALARSAGADDVILYTHSDFVAETKRLTDGRGADLIIDGVGKTTFPGDLEAVARRGHIVLFGSASGAVDPFPPNTLQARSITVSGGSLVNFTLTREETLGRAEAVLAGIREGWLRLNIGKVFPLAEAAEAHRFLESRESTGKIILAI